MPTHVAIVMDGNGRWATERGLPRLAGHRAGAENIRRVVEYSLKAGLLYLTLYAFSTENWSRPRSEVRGLLRLLAEAVERETPRLNEAEVRINHLGRLDRLPLPLAETVIHAVESTRHNTRLNLNICFDYSGRAELLDAVRQIVAEHVPAESIDERLIRRHLYSHDQPDPDLIIRTAGEQRLSNFLVWQAAYSEYYFTPCHWPDFGPDEFRQALLDYGSRLRKFGKTPEQVRR